MRTRFTSTILSPIFSIVVGLLAASADLRMTLVRFSVDRADATVGSLPVAGDFFGGATALTGVGVRAGAVMNELYEETNFAICDESVYLG